MGPPLNITMSSFMCNPFVLFPAAAPPANPWQLNFSTYSGNSFSLAGQSAANDGMYVRPDGLRLYVIGDNAIRQYNLSSAWDVTSMTFHGSFAIGIAANWTQVFFKGDGTRCYGTQTTNDRISQFNLSTAWDITTASNPSQFKATTGTAPRGMFWRDDGTRVYTIDSDQDRVEQYLVSSAWDVTTAGTLNASFSVSGLGGAPQGMFIRDDGVKMYITEASDNELHQYTLSTPWAINTAVADGVTKLVNAQDTAAREISWKPDGSKYFLLGQTNDTVYEFTVS